MITLMLTSGSGPEECRIAVGHVADEICKQAKDASIIVSETGPARTGRDHPKSVFLELTGPNVSRLADRFIGSIKVVFKSPVRPGHKRQNWYVGVEAIEHSSKPEDAILDPADVRFETLRAGGPGGQHQNTTDSAVRAIHVPTGIATLARDERSQHRNKAVALRRIETMLQVMANERHEKGKRDVFLSHKALERGNEVMTLRP